MNSIKQLVYFLLACNVKQTVRFLHKYTSSFEENKSFSKNFIKYSKSFFKQNKRFAHLSEKDLFLVWRNFCKKHSYEEVLSLVLCQILQYPKEKVSWLLKIQPETLSWRLNQGLLALEEEWLKVEKEENKDGRKVVFPEGGNVRLDEHSKSGKSKAMIYCTWLAGQILPKEVEQITYPLKSKEIKYRLLILLCCIVFVIVIFLGILILPSSSKVILYMSF